MIAFFDDETLRLFFVQLCAFCASKNLIIVNVGSINIFCINCREYSEIIFRNGNNMKYKKLVAALFLSMAGSAAAHAEQIGSVDTVFKMIGPDHKIVVEAFDDPDVENVTCYISRAKTGGIKGGLGLAEDTSDAAISCQQVGPIAVSDKIKNGKAQGEVVFQKRTSLVFKKLQVVRFYDAKRNALVYLSYSDKVVDGSPKNALSAVPIMPWSK